MNVLSSKYIFGRGKVLQNIVLTTTKRNVPTSCCSSYSSSYSFRHFSSKLKLQDSYSNIIVTQHDPESSSTDGHANGHLSVGLIELNRPRALNALSDALFDDLIHATKTLNEMESIGSIVITGKGKAFAAGADIEEMSEKEFSDAYKAVSES